MGASNQNSADEVRTAVEHAAVGATAWRRAVYAQQEATPDHSDWYELTGEIVDTLRCLASLSTELSPQVESYGDGRVLRDDVGWDPAERLDAAVSRVEQLGDELDRAERTANQFWSEISHIGVEVDR